MIKAYKYRLNPNERHNNRDLLAAINIKRFGLQRQNLNTPSVGGEEDVEWSALADTVKRQYINA